MQMEKPFYEIEIAGLSVHFKTLIKFLCPRVKFECKNSRLATIDNSLPVFPLKNPRKC